MTERPAAKDRFTALDTLAVVRELRNRTRARVDKAFDLTDGGWSLVFRVPGEGRLELRLVPGRYAALVPFGEERGEELSPFARELRRLLTGAVLDRVSEPGGERFLELTFTRGDATDGLRLLLELFGTGNLIVAQGETIAAAATSHRWAHRTVRAGAPFVRAPARPDPWGLSREEIAARLAASDADLTRTLAARLGLGGPLAEEAVARLGVAGAAPAAEAAAERAERLVDLLRGLRDELGPAPAGWIYRWGEEPIDVTPFRSVRWEGNPDVRAATFPSFSAAAREYFRRVIPSAPDPLAARALAEQGELDRKRAQQRAAVQALEAEVAALRSDGEAVLAAYPEVEAVLAAARAAGGEEREVAWAHDGRVVHLALDRSPRESAHALFEESKRLGGKLAGARAALVESERQAVRPGPGGSGAGGAAARPAAPRRTFWFERYRWFVSSEGAVAIAGKDAPSNDVVVKKHLKDGDVYLHADLHGAASVVVKRPAPGGPAFTETTLREAGQWAVAFSKAWRAGLAAASAFWVRPDQVSKAAASGEFVPRGAWVIHGTKNFLKDLPLELALGPIRYESEERWVVAPEAAVRARGAVRAILAPGVERERPEVEAALARDLGLSRSLVQSLLPAGGLTVRRV